MVYYGKPSKACDVCRAKRRKCDFQIPECGPCKRSGAPSCRYRREVDALFKDQTNATVWRHGNVGRQRAAAIAPLVTRPLGLPGAVEDLALAHFFRSYRCSPRVSALVDVRNLAKEESVLLTCMMALGSATYSIHRKSAHMNREAIRLYLDSLAAVNAALALPSTAQCDDILLAVMILSGFDTANGTPLAIVHQATHVSGCTTLLDIRGVQQMRTAEGRLLFIQACVNVVSSCLRSKVPIPNTIHSLTYLGRQYFDEDEDLRSAWITHKARLQITDSYCNIEAGHISDSSQAVQRLLHLDSKLAPLVARKLLDDTWLCPFPREMTLGSVLSHSRTASMQTYQELGGYNTIRGYRIMLHSLILRFSRQLTAGHNSLAAQIDSSNSVIHQQQSQILESVPQQLALALTLRQNSDLQKHDILSPPLGISHANAALANIAMMESLYGQRMFLTEEAEPGILRSSHGYAILWPLLLVGLTSQPCSNYRKNTIKMLQQMGGDLGIIQAYIFAERLKGGEEV